MIQDLWRMLTSPQARKFQMVLIGFAAAAATAGLLPAAVSVWVLLIVGVLTSAGVYVVPNSATPVLQEPVVAPVVVPAPVSEPKHVAVTEIYDKGGAVG